MEILRIAKTKTTHPTGDPNFAVQQAFPAAVSAEEADPFLMCDRFGPVVSEGKATSDDEFPIGWHPHIGMDIATYMDRGVGRHADSMGNREEFASPGMQWISVGSGIEHAEGGGTPKGDLNSGFQIWINVPSQNKLDDPAYGTESPDKLPLVEPADGVAARILAGTFSGGKDNKSYQGPFRTKAPLEMIDFRFTANASFIHSVPDAYDNAVLYVFEGDAVINSAKIPLEGVALMKGDSKNREIKITAGDKGAAVMLFAGKKLKEPIAWHGPFVMNTQKQIRDVFAQYQAGRFPPKRVAWDYRRIDQFPQGFKPIRLEDK